MWEQDERVAGLLSGPKIKQPRLASSQADCHLIVEDCVRQNELDLIWIEPARLKAFDASSHLLGLQFLHQARGLVLRNERSPCCFEGRVAHVVITMEMAVDHPL